MRFSTAVFEINARAGPRQQHAEALPPRCRIPRLMGKRRALRKSGRLVRSTARSIPARSSANFEMRVARGAFS
eukprot:3239070-Pyramimonas_sp.AAC.1